MVAISASIHCIPWKLEIDLPNCFLSLAYLTARSKAPWAIPTACEATPGRDLSKVFIVIIKPIPSLSRRFSLGTLQSVKMSSLVTEARIPILSSFLPKVNPGIPFSKMKAEAPLAPLEALVIAITV